MALPPFKNMPQEKKPGADWTVWYQEEGEPVYGMSVFGSETIFDALDEAKWSFSPQAPDKAHEDINFLAIVRDGIPFDLIRYSDVQATSGYLIAYQVVATGERKRLVVPLATNLEEALRAAEIPVVPHLEDPAAHIDILAIVQLGLPPELWKRFQ